MSLPMVRKRSGAMSKELKSCPFCGSENIEIYRDWFSDYWIIGCRECEAERNRFLCRADAVTFWNTRSLNHEKDKEIARLKEKLNNVKQEIIRHRDSYTQLIEHHDFNTATSAYAMYTVLNSFIEMINATDNNVGSMEE